MEGGETVVLEEAGCNPPTEGIRSYRAIALTSVMLEWISCQHLQVMVTNLKQKHWEWHEERNPVMKDGTVVRPTVYMASLDIKTAFDEAKPKHVAKIMDSHNTHGFDHCGPLA